MCEIFDKVWQDGIEYGRREGIEFGEQKSLTKIIFHMLDLQMDSEKISELIGEPISTVAKIQEKYMLTEKADRL